MKIRARLATAALAGGLALTACGSGGSSPTASPTSSAATAPSATTASPRSTAAALAGGPTCPTLAQADAALGVSDSGPIRTPAEGGGAICEYTGAGNAGVTIYAHQTATNFAGQVANAGRAPGMQKISGVGSGAFAVSTDGRSIVNAYADGSRTFVAAQAPGLLAHTEALARVALADN